MALRDKLKLIINQKIIKMKPNSLNNYLENISKRRRQVLTSKEEIEEANNYIWDSKNPEELILSFRNIKIHGGFKIQIMNKLKQDFPSYFKS
jgi:hypothetical protein